MTIDQPRTDYLDEIVTRIATADEIVGTNLEVTASAIRDNVHATDYKQIAIGQARKDHLPEGRSVSQILSGEYSAESAREFLQGALLVLSLCAELELERRATPSAEV